MYRLLLFTLVIIKIYMIVKTVIRRNNYQPARVSIKHGLGDTYDPKSETFHILNRRNVSWVLYPRKGCEEQKLLMLISSGPKSNKLRQKWRKAIEGVKDLKVIFMISTPVISKEDTLDIDSVQKMLKVENDLYGDILQSSLKDGHRKLGYKILTGYIWSYIHCRNAVLVGKTDDNVVLEMESLMRGVDKMRRESEQRPILCGSGTPHRNMKPLRSDKGPMSGNWSISIEQVDNDYHPDFCAGFLYLTTPSVGAELVQAGLSTYGNKEVEQIEDGLITGQLREKLDNVVITSLSAITTSSWSSYIWVSILSHCPLFSMAKLTFGNELVVTKYSSRGNVMYVGPVTNHHLWRYYACLNLEYVLEVTEDFIPEYIQNFFFDFCKR